MPALGLPCLLLSGCVGGFFGPIVLEDTASIHDACLTSLALELSLGKTLIVTSRSISCFPQCQ